MAGDVIDSLSIELNSNATKANKAVDELISKLGNIANSLTRIDGSKLNAPPKIVHRSTKRYIVD